jgi:hypothetical protein
MKENVPLYILTLLLLAATVYLKSPMIAVSIVALWGVKASEAIFTRKNRDEDITEMLATMASHKAKMDALTRDITNVSERARVILGENF